MARTQFFEGSLIFGIKSKLFNKNKCGRREPTNKKIKNLFKFSQRNQFLS